MNHASENYSDIEQLCHLTQLLHDISAYEETAGNNLTGSTEYLRCLASVTAQRVLADVQAKRAAAALPAPNATGGGSGP